MKFNRLAQIDLLDASFSLISVDSDRLTWAQDHIIIGKSSGPIIDIMGRRCDFWDCKVRPPPVLQCNFKLCPQC